ncbi:MAG: FtsW/RodA/SpoVE family cell cycle protein [Clostridiaceae bacterium]|nr:FtsW/RodA/SpoVE family cell cycle protein [Clostridiaceae bacterium]
MMQYNDSQPIYRRAYFRALDYWLLVPVLALCVIGLFVLNNVLINNPAYLRNWPRSIYIQAGAVIFGLVAMIMFSLLSLPMLRISGYVLWVLSFVLQLALLRFGDREVAASTGSNAWLKLPFIGSFQPSELAKIATCLVVGMILEGMRTGRIERHGWLYIALTVAPQLGLVIGFQKDLGTALVFMVMISVMIFVWGIKLRYVLITISALVMAVPLVFIFVLRPFQQSRLISFLFPALDPQSTYNVTQAKRAIAYAGLAGSEAARSVHVPVQPSDFIFSAVAAWLGWIGALMVIFLTVFYLIRCFLIAKRTDSLFGRYTVSGLTAIFAFHFVENVGMNLGLMPVTGIPLPFVSQGGTAMLMNFMSLGIIMCFSLERWNRTWIEQQV